VERSGLSAATISNIQRLIFFEYDERRSEGIRSSAWHDIIFSSTYHPLQDVFAENKDLFTVMFPWEKKFSIHVYYSDGSFKSWD
jgi:hypothetical protein